MYVSLTQHQSNLGNGSNMTTTSKQDGIKKKKTERGDGKTAVVE